MPYTDESRLEAGVGSRHQDGCPFHFTSLNQDDRIRRVFRLQDKSALPSVNEEALAKYYDHMVASLSMPFEAIHCPTGGDMRQLIHYLQVLELTDPRQSRQRNGHGLSCKARNSKAVLEIPLADLGVHEDSPNCQLLDDYAYWFVNCR